MTRKERYEGIAEIMKERKPTKCPDTWEEWISIPVNRTILSLEKEMAEHLFWSETCKKETNY